MNQTQAALAVAVPSKQGEARWWFGALAEIKATAAQTSGQFTLVEVSCAPGYQGVRHVHHREDEAFWILEGDVTLDIGGTVIEATSGDYAFGPRDIPHSFSVGDKGCRMLFILTPGGFEDLVMATSEPAATRTVPPLTEEMPSMEQMQQMQAVVARFGGEILP
jgi:quercetin dioxygenase-like cupin family protein